MRFTRCMGKELGSLTLSLFSDALNLKGSIFSISFEGYYDTIYAVYFDRAKAEAHVAACLNPHILFFPVMHGLVRSSEFRRLVGNHRLRIELNIRKPVTAVNKKAALLCLVSDGGRSDRSKGEFSVSFKD